MGIAVLGPLTIDGGGPPTRIAARDRVVLAALVAAGGDAVRLERLAEAVWGERPPASWRKVLQGCVARLRRVLGAAAIVTVPDGYRVALVPDEIDARCFEHLLERARELLALGAADHALFVAGEALALWRGPALPELEAWQPGRTEAGRLAELRLDAEEVRVEAALAADRQGEVLADARAQVAAAPLRERRWALLARAQYRSGRQGEALASLRRARQVLGAELGVDPGPELAGVERAILRQDPALGPAPRPPVESAACPYLGLVAYDVGDAEAFFGREDDTAACLRRLADAGVLVVVGASGSGKSSLVRAGVAAALRRQGHAVTVLHPGHRPAAPADLPGAGTDVLVVDQCEEVVTLCRDPGARAAFLTGLAGHAVRAPLVVALRADRLGEVCEHPGFARLVERGLYVLGAMREPQLRTAVEAPARRSGLLLEPGLVDLLVRDVEGEPGALPLLSHALRQTWRRRAGRTLTVAGYRATGGIRGAVANTAEELYDRTPVPSRPVLRDLLLRLVAVTPDGEPNRRRVPRRLVAAGPAQDRIMEDLVAARLVTADEHTVALAHEALTRVWPRMLSWLDEDAEGQRLRRHLSFAAEAWAGMGRPDSEVYRGARLARAAEWRDRSRPSLSATEEAFLTASRELADAEQAAAARRAREQARANRRLRALLAVAVALLVVAGGAGVYAGRQADRAGAAALSAEARRISALAGTTANADQSLLLAAGAVRMDDTAVTRAGLLAALARNPQLIGVLHGPERAATRPRVTADGSSLVVLNGARVGVFDTGTHTGSWQPHVPLAGAVPGAAAIRADGEQVALPYGLLDAPAVRLVDTRRPSARSVRPGRLAFDSIAAAAAYSPDGRRLAVVYQQEQHEAAEVRIWTLDDPDWPPSAVAVPWLTDVAGFSPDGRVLYTAGPGGQVVLDALTGRRLRSSPLPGPPLELSPDGRVLAVASPGDGGVVLVDAGSGRERARLSGGSRIRQLRFSPDGRLLAGAAGDNTTTVWATATGEPVEVLHGHATGVTGLAFGRDGGTLYTSDGDGSTLVWDLRGDRRVLARRALERDPGRADGGVVVSPGVGAAVFRARAAREPLRVVDLRNGRTVAEILHRGARVLGVAWRPDGARLATTDDRGHVEVWDPRTGRRVAGRQVSHVAVPGVAWSPDGRRLIVTDDRVLQLDAASLQPVADLLRLPGGPAGRPAIAPDGRAVVAFEGVAGEAAPADASRSVTYADLSGATARTWTVGVGGVAGAFSPDGRRFAAAGGNGEVVLLEAGGAPVRPPVAAHDGPAGPVAFSADGRTVVVGGADGRVTVWDGRTGEPLGGIAAARPGVRTHPAFLPDGHTVVIVSSDGAVHTWDARPRAWIAHACRIAGRDLTPEERTRVAGDHLPASPC
ncbi:nSTAND1 domain-containing NTPase [Actinoplanes sp. URMC 104]|uniref:nSTAND1 domain-containing NTPase n=1 Tax=Actinoplanes sp. URMC 104 TaxID=3423409 RepID=UPI003F195EE1